MQPSTMNVLSVARKFPTESLKNTRPLYILLIDQKLDKQTSEQHPPGTDPYCLTAAKYVFSLVEGSEAEKLKKDNPKNNPAELQKGVPMQDDSVSRKINR